MSTLTQVRTAFKTVLEANISGLVVYSTVPDVTQVPCVVVVPSSCEYVVGMGSCQMWHFDLPVLTPRADPATGQDSLDSYLSLSGANSIPAVIKANPSLGLSDVSVVLRKMTDYGGEWPVAKIQHVGAMLHVDAIITM